MTKSLWNTKWGTVKKPRNAAFWNEFEPSEAVGTCALW